MSDRDYSGLTVLVADDGVISRKMAAAGLKQIGVGRVIEVSGGQAALDQLAAPDCAVDVVIADVRMPGIDGLTLAKKIKSGEAGCDPAISVVLLTATIDSDSPAAAEDLGVAAMLAKPASVEVLRKALGSARP